jgi:hypothetical protein
MFEYIIHPFQKIGGPDLLQELRRKGSIIHQPLVEPANRVCRLGESTFIELICELQQPVWITQTFFECMSDLFVIFAEYFSTDCTDEKDVDTFTMKISGSSFLQQLGCRYDHQI